MENIEEFSLKWNYFHSNLATGFHDLLKEEMMVDVTLAAEGKILRAHKIILSVCSPYFRDLFKVNPCQHPIVILKDVGHQAMADLLDFIYRGEAKVRGEDVAAFLKLAETLKIKGLAGGKADDEDAPPPPFSEAPRKSSVPKVPKKKQAEKTPIFESDAHDLGDTDYNWREGGPRRRKRRATSPSKTEFAMPFPSSSSGQSFPLAHLKQEMPDPLIEENEEASEPLGQLIAGEGTELKQDFDDFDFDNLLEDPGDGSHEMNFDMNPCPSNPEHVPQVLDRFDYSFTLTQKGRPKLLHLGYEYTNISIKKRASSQTHWQCTKYKTITCKARAILGTTGLTITGAHNHKPTFHHRMEYVFDA